MTMLTDRLEDLSIKYWLDEIFSAYPSITVVDGFPAGELQLPTIAIENGEISLHPFELGSNTSLTYRIWHISVYTSNKAQRDDFSSYIINKLDTEGIPVYNYNEGFPPTVVTQIGTLVPEQIVARPVRIFPDLVEKLYWRETISFITQRLGG